MKSNVTLRSKDRDLFGITIRQNTKDSMLSISDLQKAYDKARFMHGCRDRRINDITNSAGFKMFSYIYLKEKNIITNSFIEYNAEIKNIGVVKMLKRLKVWNTIGKAENRHVSCVDVLWKYLYINMFLDYHSINTPQWVRDIDVSVYRKNLAREESLELHFINYLIDKVEMITTEKPIKQYVLGSYRYDLLLCFKNKKVLIEYNEIQGHRYSKDKDLAKAKYAYENGFCILHILEAQEHEIKKYIIDILNNDINEEDCYNLARKRLL